jgi:class 3 adenylate cyclase
MRRRRRGTLGFFMDRHDLDGETAADLASAHLRDLDVQARHDVRFLSYWFDYDRNAAFCLFEAPDAAAAAAVHREAHGAVTHEIIAVDPARVERFLGPTDDPVLTGREADSAFRIILFTDLVGSTAMVQRLGDEEAMRLLRRHDAIVRGALDAHGGVEVKHTGDGIMASFASVRDALAAGVAIQRDFADHNARHPDRRMALRIGMSAGEPVAEHGDLFGAAVQLAARLCAHAAPGRIVVAGVVADLALGKGFRFGERDAAALRGFPEPVPVCEVLWDAGT